MGEPQVKRQKTEMDPIFREFHDNVALLNELKHAVDIIRNGYNHMNLALQSILQTNACSVVSFSKATVTIKTNEDAGNMGAFVAGSIFCEEIHMLEQYIDAKKVPNEYLRRNVLAKLLKFLSKEDHTILWEKKGQETEKDSSTLLMPTRERKEQTHAIKIAQHLLTKLTVNSTYTIDSSYGAMKKCTCKDHEDLLGKPGDTSYGCMKAWMGNADIIMEDSVPVTVIAENDDTQLETSSRSSVSTVEIKGTDDYSQIRAQSIVFSFYQQKHNLEKIRTCLVPGIGISTEKLYYSFYDSEHDVMLLSCPLPMWNMKKVVTYSMVVFSLDGLELQIVLFWGH